MAILLVPDLDQSVHCSWQGRWQDSLGDAGRVPLLRSAGTDAKAALPVLAASVRRRPGAILAGHGMSATLIPYLVAEYPDLPIGGALLMTPDDPERMRAWTHGGLGPLPLGPLPFPSILVACRPARGMDRGGMDRGGMDRGGRDRGGMTFRRARIMARLWESAFVETRIADASHVWPDGEALLDRLRGMRDLAAQPSFAPLRTGAPTRPPRVAVP